MSALPVLTTREHPGQVVFGDGFDLVISSQPLSYFTRPEVHWQPYCSCHLLAVFRITACSESLGLLDASIDSFATENWMFRVNSRILRTGLHRNEGDRGKRQGEADACRCLPTELEFGSEQLKHVANESNDAAGASNKLEPKTIRRCSIKVDRLLSMVHRSPQGPF